MARALFVHGGVNSRFAPSRVPGRVITVSTPTRYGVAIAAAAAGTLLRLALNPLWGVGLPFVFMFPSIMLSAWFGGFWPGVCTTLLSAVAADYFWMTPLHSQMFNDPADLLALFIFIASGVVISALNEGWRRATAAAIEAERERAALFEKERAARTQAETAEQQLKLAVQAGRMGTWQYTMSTGAVAWSPGLEAIHGFSPGSFPGTFEAFRNEIHPADRDRVLEAIGAAVEQRRDHHVEYRIVRPDGAVRWVEGRGQLFCDREGRPERMVGVCLDVTERKQVEEERAQLLVREQAARAEVERASRLKDEFLAALSHELRTPLNAVLGYAQLLGTGSLPPERAAHALEAIQRNAQAQARLIESLLDLSRIIAGKLELDLERLDLSSIVDAAVDVLRPEAEAKDLVLDVVASPSRVPLVGDGGRLQQVLWNLLSNAVKFTPPGGRVSVRVAREDSQVQIQVSDSGQGISPEFLPHVFDRFKQADHSKGRAQGGLGLGLALAREIVQAHGGTLVAESLGEGHGSTFIATLPVSAVGDVPSEPTELTVAKAARTENV